MEVLAPQTCSLSDAHWGPPTFQSQSHTVLCTEEGTCPQLHTVPCLLPSVPWFPPRDGNLGLKLLFGPSMGLQPNPPNEYLGVHSHPPFLTSQADPPTSMQIISCKLVGGPHPHPEMGRQGSAQPEFQPAPKCLVTLGTS